MAFRNRGLVLPMQRVEAQAVTVRHKVLCCVCGALPVGRRLLVQVGSGRSHRTDVFCRKHGTDYLEYIGTLSRRAGRYLAGDTDDCIRVPEPDAEIKRARTKADAERRKWTTRDRVRVEPGTLVYHPRWSEAGVVEDSGVASFLSRALAASIPMGQCKIRECYANRDKAQRKAAVATVVRRG
jgi:hypothetical protein